MVNTINIYVMTAAQIDKTVRNVYKDRGHDKINFIMLR